jgi:heme-degrading monooxygenase HmoA
MYIVTNRITVAADIAEAFEETFATSMRDTLKGVPGLQRATLQRPEVDGHPYISTMDFDTKDHFLAWLKSDSFKASHSNASAPGMNSPN